MLVHHLKAQFAARTAANLRDRPGPARVSSGVEHLARPRFGTDEVETPSKLKAAITTP